MNTKRVVAILIALVVLMASFVISMLKLTFKTSTLANFSQKNRHNIVNEKIIEQGNKNSKIAVVEIKGIIEAGLAQDNIMDTLENVRNDEQISAVIIEVDTPGGGVYEAAEISDKIKQIKKERQIPFYVSMGSMCASGGYYIVANCDKIYASKETMTGSIGVIMSSLNLSGLFEKYGISSDVIKSGKYKDIGSSVRPMTESERQIMQKMIDDSYQEFVNVVSEGRDLSKDYVKSIADGRVYDGRQALEIKLIDDIGYFEDALLDLRRDYDLDSSQVIHYQYNDSIYDLADILGSIADGVSKSNIQKEIEGIKSVLEQPQRLMYLYGGR